jgi:4-amino-4-deoxy-L-arabinose transferase-like glycosyltransferase
VERVAADDKGGRTAFSARVAGLLAALAAFVLYWRTLAPTVLYYDYPAMRDSTALQVKAYLLGIPDVTGYPTYAMLTHLFTYLPFGDPAYRVNLASAVFGAATVFLFYLVCRRLTGRTSPSLAAALLFALSETFWSQAVIAEVYTLNTLFVAAIVLVLLIWRDERRDLYLLLTAFLMGLSLTHHLTSGLLLPAGLLFVLLVDRSRILQRRLVFGGVGLFLLGLLPYLYLPARASMEATSRAVLVHPTLVVQDPSIFGGFFDLVTGGDFRGAMFTFGPAELPGRFVYYLGYLSEQFHPGFLAVALLGVAYLLAKDWAALALLGSLYLGWLFYALEYDIADVYYQFIPTYLVLAVFVAAGLAALLRGVERLMAGRLARVRVAAVIVASSVVVLAPLVGVGETYAAVDRSEDDKGRRMLEAVAEKAELEATVIHHRSPLWYMTLVEGRRRDIQLVASFEIGMNDREIEAAKAALRTGTAVYILQPNVSDAERVRETDLDLVPVEERMLYEVVSRDGFGGRDSLG